MATSNVIQFPTNPKTIFPALPAMRRRGLLNPSDTDVTIANRRMRIVAFGRYLASLPRCEQEFRIVQMRTIADSIRENAPFDFVFNSD